MLIGGFQKFSLIDYPEKICAIVFTQGCNFRCGYCHNPELVKPEKFEIPISEKDFFSFLNKRQKKLDAVVITGGEPTLQKDLIPFVKKIKSMGYLIKLDSNGSDSEVLKNIFDLKIIDYIAMDIKAPLKGYFKIINTDIDTKNIKKSIKQIMNSKINYEFRTTVVKDQLFLDDFEKIGKLIKSAELYVLQKFIPTKTNDLKFLKKQTYSDKEFENIKKIMQKYVQKCIVR